MNHTMLVHLSGQMMKLLDRLTAESKVIMLSISQAVHVADVLADDGLLLNESICLNRGTVQEFDTNISTKKIPR